MSSLTLTFIQANLSWENKIANLDMLERKIMSIAGKTELVLLPEMFSTGFSMRPEIFAEPMSGETVSWMKRVSREKNVILTGSVIIEDNGNYFNRLIWMLPNGVHGYYDKRHLFAYAGENEHYEPGHKRLIASVNGWRVNLQVCYDLRFPVWARQQIHGNHTEYDLLIYVANWPQRRSHAWKTLLQARAIENQCYVAGVNRVGYDGNDIYHSGDSMLVDGLGQVLYHKADADDIHTITIHKSDLDDTRSRFPFWKDADDFSLTGF